MHSVHLCVTLFVYISSPIPFHQILIKLYRNNPCKNVIVLYAVFLFRFNNLSKSYGPLTFSDDCKYHTAGGLAFTESSCCVCDDFTLTGIKRTLL